MDNPLVSVVLPVYNAGKYLKDCLDSIDKQTYRPIELIAVDDCSTDDSFDILFKFSKGKKWVKILQNDRNKGVSPSFNYGVAEADGQFIARMDADDLMVPTRIEKQVDFLKKHPDVVIVGGQCFLIDKDGKNIGKKTFPLRNNEIYEMLFKTVPMQQPTIMINRKLLPKDFLFGNAKFSPAEDYGLFFSAAKYGKLANLPDFTHYYREHGTNISLVRPKFTFWRIWRARLDGLFNQGYRPSLSALFIVLAQTLAIIVLPEKYIYPLHKALRGMDK